MGFTARAFALSIALGCAASLAAADPSIENGYLDVRVGYTFARPTYTETQAGGTDESFHWDRDHEFSGEIIGSPAMKARGGLLLGVSLLADWRDRNDNASDIRLQYREWAIRLHVGYGIPLGGTALLEIVPFGGLGETEARRAGDTDQDLLIQYGLDVALPLTFGHVQIGPQVGYQVEDSETAIRTGTGTSADQDFKDGYFTYSVFLGLRF